MLVLILTRCLITELYLFLFLVHIILLFRYIVLNIMEKEGFKNCETQVHNALKKLSGVKIYFQNVEHVVKIDDVTPDTSLNSYLRNNLHMTGTKAMCYEGGCGACVVVLEKEDLITGKKSLRAVNSCLTPVLSCDGWNISTVENIGNSLEGYHPIQEVLAKFNGTQCGFCSPGMVMNMYALYKSGNVTMKDVENSFSGNLCRCTGYRPILSAFKSLCEDADPDLLGTCVDIEDLRLCRKENCVNNCTKPCDQPTREPFYLETNSKWVKVYTLNDLLQILTLQTKCSYRLVAGNTAQGVRKAYKKNVELYIDITDVIELKIPQVSDDYCILGANMTLTDTIEFFKQVSDDFPQFAYLKLMADHINLVANVPVRNRGTLAGNLMIKHDHHDFPSDIFLILETVKATLTIVDLNGQETQLTPLDFINHDMKLKILKTISLNALSNTERYVSYKIMPRAQNVHALVNAGFLFKFDENDLIQAVNMVYGHINPQFVHAKKTEKFLIGKNLFDNSVLQKTYSLLGSELDPSFSPPEPSPEFRKQLSIALFYKAVLSIAPKAILSPRNKSGSTLLERPISTGVQDYETNKSMYPLTQAIPKLEALAQTSGKAQYIEDMPDLPHQLFGALVLANAPPNSIIEKIDATKALNVESVIAFYTKDDIPGENAFTRIRPYTNFCEEIFCNGRVQYYDQPVGVLIGKNRKTVEEAVDLVEVFCTPPNVEPLITIPQAVKTNRNDRIHDFKTINSSSKGTDIEHVIKGSFDIYHQYHFHMETQCCNVVPNENGLDVYASTQFMELVQSVIARMLNISVSTVNVTVRRCGGGFGGKISRNGLVSCAAALASWQLQKPVKIHLPLTTNMAAIGKRFPFSATYEAAVNENGVMQYLDCDLYTDVGAVYSEDCSHLIENAFSSVYNSETFNLRMKRVITDTHSNTWTRAPGSAEGIGALESIMEHIAHNINMDPLEFRLANLSNHTPLANYISDIKSWANIDQRKKDIATFNKENRWKKKGIAVIPMNYDMVLLGPYLVTVAIFHDDGSVQISHGGVEIGQGINTKVAQVCAYKLKIPLEKITVLPSNSFSSANSVTTAASITSEAVCYAVLQACDELLNRIKPYQTEGSTWENVIKKSHSNFVNLIATGTYSPKAPGVHLYSIYGICATEVLVDILTGQHLITRVDLIEDTGVTLNPAIDIGQVEGAFVMGIGYYTTEKIIFNSEGKILTTNTWTYHPPGAKDIPIDFRVKFPKNNPNPVGVLQSKAIGEPAFCFAITVPLAIRNALASARTDVAPANLKWYPIDGPTDVENTFLNSLNDPSLYTL